MFADDRRHLRDRIQRLSSGRFLFFAYDIDQATCNRPNVQLFQRSNVDSNVGLSVLGNIRKLYGSLFRIPVKRMVQNDAANESIGKLVGIDWAKLEKCGSDASIL